MGWVEERPVLKISGSFQRERKATGNERKLGRKKTRTRLFVRRKNRKGIFPRNLVPGSPSSEEAIT